MTILTRPWMRGVPASFLRTFDPANPAYSQNLALYADLWHPEQQGYALSYDGNDLASYTVAGFRSGDSSGTIGVWFRTTFSGATQTLVSSSDTAGNLKYLRAGTLSAGTFFLEHNNTNGVNTVAAFNDGLWHYAVAVSTDTSWIIFVDGVLQSLTVYAGANNGNWFADAADRDNVIIGAHKQATTIHNFTGVIGPVRIYSRQIALAEAQVDYQRGWKAAPSDTTGLVYNLPCTEGTGNPVDTVGGITMTLTGATWIESLIDRSTNAYPITLFGSPVWGITGRTLALNKYGIVTSPALNYTSGDFSGWAWVKTTDLTTTNFILNRGLSSVDGWGFYILSTGSFGIQTSQAAAIQSSFTAAAAVLVNTWYMLGFSRAGVVGKVWKNVSGVMTNVTGTSGNHVNPLTSARTLKIGAYDNLALALIGTMGEADVTGRNLLAADFQQIFNATRGRYGV